MVCWHPRRTLGDEQPRITPKSWRTARRYKHILPLFLMDHSGLCMSTSPFACPWDSGQVGWIYILAADVRKRLGGDEAKALELLKREVFEYSQFLEGTAYGIETLDDQDEVIDFYGSFWTEEDARATILEQHGPAVQILVQEV